MKTKNYLKNSSLQKSLSSTNHSPLFTRSAICLVAAIFLLAGSVSSGYADNNVQDSGVNSSGPGFGPSSNEYELAIIKEIQSDGTLLLANGRRIKIQEADLKNPSLYSNRKVVIFTKGGIYHLDREGRIVGSLVILNAPYQIENANTDSSSEGNFMGTRNSDLSYGLASKSTVAAPLGLPTKEMLRETSLLLNGEVNTTGLHVGPDGRVSGSISLGEASGQTDDSE